MIWKKGWLSASLQVIRRRGSICKHLRSKSTKTGQLGIIYSSNLSPITSSMFSTLSWLTIPLTKILLNDESSGILSIISVGYMPDIFSIIAKCWISSWVPNKSSPVMSSLIMHPIDHTSLISLQGMLWRITSGDRYCRVLIIELWCSLYFVAPPKSIILIFLLSGR